MTPRCGHSSTYVPREAVGGRGGSKSTLKYDGLKKRNLWVHEDTTVGDGGHTHTPHFTPILDSLLVLPGASTPAQSPATPFTPTLTSSPSPPRSSRGGKYKGEESLAKPWVTAAVQHGSQCGTRLWRKGE